jgi:hypothetical protein
MKNKKQFLLLSLVLLATLGCFGQLATPRKLEAFKSSEDSLCAEGAELKRDKSGNIAFLKQTIFDKDGKIILEEYFKAKGKKVTWRLIQFPNDSVRIFYNLLPGGSVEFANIYQGNFELSSGYTTDLNFVFPKKLARMIFCDYYSNGQLKYKIEQRDGKQGILVGRIDNWNILEYYYPDGKPYTDWGTLKDGVGYYNLLDDNGKICDVCTENIKKEAAKKEEAKKKN